MIYFLKIASAKVSFKVGGGGGAGVTKIGMGTAKVGMGTAKVGMGARVGMGAKK